MKQYKITIKNGKYPFTRMCGSISEAYGTLAAYWEMTDSMIGLDGLMRGLVELESSGKGYYGNPYYQVDVLEAGDAERT